MILSSHYTALQVCNTTAINVARVAMGTRHAVLLAAKGDMYAWGYGRGPLELSKASAGRFFSVQAPSPSPFTL